jgi:hypothetical protein
MGLVGQNGTYPSDTVQNHVSDGTFSASKLDTSLRAIVNEIGGICWEGGQEKVRAPNLQGANFNANPGFTNTHKQEPYFETQLVICRGKNAVDNGFGERPLLMCAPVPFDFTVRRAEFSPYQPTAAEMTVDVYVNGALTFSVTAPQATGTDLGGVTVPLGFMLHRGDLVVAEVRGVTSSIGTDVIDPNLVLFGFAPHVSLTAVP